MRSRSVSITGATGFVGWHVAEAFLREGWDVRAVVRHRNRRPVPAGAQTVESSLSATALGDAFAGSDVVVHCAALIRARDEESFARVNVDGTRAAVAAAERAKSRFVLVSSQAAGGQGTPAAPRREDDPPQPVNAYGRSKLASEAIVRASALPWTILRPCAVYGPRDRGFLPLFRLVRRGLALVPARPDAAFTLIFIHDLVRAIRLAAELDSAVGQTLFIGHPEPRTGSDVVRAIAAGEGRRLVPFRLPGPLFGAAAALGDVLWTLGVKPVIDSGRLIELRSDGFVCAVDRAREVLGFVAETSFEQGIAETARWYREHGWL
jgi:dihydroflavonol-4-reductase